MDGLDAGGEAAVYTGAAVSPESPEIADFPDLMGEHQEYCLEDEARELEGLAELFTAIANVANALGIFGGSAAALGCFWWTAEEACSRLWLGFVMCAATVLMASSVEVQQTYTSTDETSHWLMRSLSTLPPGLSIGMTYLDRVLAQVLSAWGCFSLGLWLGLQISIIGQGMPCRVELLVCATSYSVCIWLRMAILIAGAQYARNRKLEVMSRVADVSSAFQVKTWWQGPGRRVIQLIGDLGAGRSGSFLALYTWL